LLFVISCGLEIVITWLTCESVIIPEPSPSRERELQGGDNISLLVEYRVCSAPCLVSGLLGRRRAFDADCFMSCELWPELNAIAAVVTLLLRVLLQGAAVKYSCNVAFCFFPP